ncbi:unnamed protein product, partial [Adineta ricciae]
IKMMNKSKSQYTNVLIVGGGIAGLATANSLISNNIPCMIIEAQDYIGGIVLKLSSLLFWKIRDNILNKTKAIETENTTLREFLRENYTDDITSNALIEWFIKFEEEDSGCDTLDNLSLSDQIRLNFEVIQAEYKTRHHILLVRVKDLINNKIKKIFCDHLVWTTSIGYLKENFTKIFATESKLIKQKLLCIERFGFGTMNKILLIYRADQLYQTS